MKKSNNSPTNRVRNAVIIIILCIIGASQFRKKPNLSPIPPVILTTADYGNDSPAPRKPHKKPSLGLQDSYDNLGDSTSENSAPPFGGFTNTAPPPPRGTGDNNFVLPDPQERYLPPPDLSPSGPKSY